MIRRLFKSEAIWQLMDQAAVSGGNFFTTLVLARKLPPEQYGVFSILFLSLFAINACHSSLVVYPLTLDAATGSRERIGDIAGEGIIRTAALLPLHALILLGTVLFVHRLSLLPLLIGAAFAWQVQETARRTLLANKRPFAAFVPDAISYIGQGCILLLVRPNSLVGVFAVVALTSCAAAAIQVVLLRTSFHSALQREHFVRAWRLGRFTLGGNTLSMITLQFPSWVLKIFAGASAVAGYQALINAIGIGNPIMYSVSNLLIPSIARSSEQGRSAAKKTMYRYGLLFGTLIVPCAILLLIAPRFGMAMVYGRYSPYLGLSPWLRMLAFCVLADYASVVIGAYEGGSGRPETYMFVQAIGAAVLIGAGFPLIHAFGIPGAVLALLSASVVRVNSFALISWFKDTKVTPYTLVSVPQISKEGL